MLLRVTYVPVCVRMQVCVQVCVGMCGHVSRHGHVDACVSERVRAAHVPPSLWEPPRRSARHGRGTRV